MATVTIQVEANADDGDRNYDDGLGDWVFANDGNYVRTGSDNQGSGAFDITCYFRFLSVGIPAGSTILTAKLQYKLNTAYSTSSKTCDIHAEDADSAGAIANDSAMTTSQAAATSAKTTWNLATSSSTSFLDSDDFAAVIAEVVARSGWASGQNITIHLLNPTDAGMMSANQMQIKTHEVSSGADAVKLVVTYTAAPKAGGIPQTLMLHELF
jgi:hypothetical protein